MYCVIRNTLYELRFGHVPFGWRPNQVDHLLVQTSASVLCHRFSWPVIKLLLPGFGDGFADHLGLSRGLPPCSIPEFDGFQPSPYKPPKPPCGRFGNRITGSKIVSYALGHSHLE